MTNLWSSTAPIWITKEIRLQIHIYHKQENQSNLNNYRAHSFHTQADIESNASGQTFKLKVDLKVKV